MLEIKDFWMFGQGRTSEVNVRFGRTEQFGLKMAELFGRTECSFEHYLAVIFPPFDNLHIKTFFGIWEKFAAV